MKEMNTLKLRLNYWRTRRALSINQLAIDAKVSSATILKIENQHHMPRPDVVQRLAAALHVSIDELVIDESEKPHAA